MNPTSLGHTVPLSRRMFLHRGLGGIALAALLARENQAIASPVDSLPDGKPHFPPKAKSVIWLFMNGGVSHLESFDPKPELDKYAGKSIAETPYKSVQDPDKLKLAPWSSSTMPTANSETSFTRLRSSFKTRPCRHRGQRLVSARRIVHRRLGRYPIDVYDR